MEWAGQARRWPLLVFHCCRRSFCLHDIDRFAFTRTLDPRSIGQLITLALLHVQLRMTRDSEN